MNHDLYTVKSEDDHAPKPAERAPKRDAYHHGDLRAALIAAAEEIIAERGVDGFSLREAARRAKVSPAAPTHHFGDARGLLTAVALEGFRGLCDALATSDAAQAGAPRIERLRAQGRAYVAYALAEPARFDVMWRKARIDTSHPDYVAAAARAFELLRAAVEDRPAADGRPGAPGDARVIAAWSMVHGFARLALDGAFGPDPHTAAGAMIGDVIARLDV